MVMAATDCNIKKIKEIAESAKRRAARPPPAPTPPPPVYPVQQPVAQNKELLLRNNLERLRLLPENFRTIPCKHFHGPPGCMRGELCHFIHLLECKDREIPKDIFFKARNYYFAKRSQLQIDITKLISTPQLNIPEAELIMAKQNSFNTLKEILDWNEKNGITGQNGMMGGPQRSPGGYQPMPHHMRGGMH